MRALLKISSPSFALTCAVFAAVFVLSGCDGQGSKAKAAGAAKSVEPVQNAPVSVQNAAPRIAITSVRFTAPAADGPVAAVVLPNGDSVEYFEQPQSVVANQAVVRSAGRAYWIYYDLVGQLSRVLDTSSGDYLVVRLRADTLGAEYLSFNKVNQFIEGNALFKDPSRWFLAPVLGQMPQLTFSMSAKAIPQTQTPPLTGSMSLSSTKLAYGPVVVMPAIAQTILNGEDAQSFLGGSLQHALYAMIPSAHADTSTAINHSTLSDGLNLAVIGATAFAPTSAASLLFAAASAASIYRQAAGLPHLGLRKTFLKRDQMLEYAVSESYADRGAAGVGLVERVRNGAAVVLSKGIGSIATPVPRSVTEAAQMPAQLQPSARLADPTPEKLELPKRPLRNTQLVGQGVDDQGRNFTATGTVSQDDVVNVVANGPGGESLTMTGKFYLDKFVGANFVRTIIPIKKTVP